jgi:hypothetical protein
MFTTWSRKSSSCLQTSISPRAYRRCRDLSFPGRTSDPSGSIHPREHCPLPYPARRLANPSMSPTLPLTSMWRAHTCV